MDNYRKCLDFLYSLCSRGTKLGLNNIYRLLALLGDPQEGLRFYHIAGTNGKGSVAAILQALLRTNRRRVGLFTSPHLEDFRERIRVNDSLIAPEEVVAGISQIQPLLELVAGSAGCSHPTYFEVVTALACLYFRKKKADAVVWEVGLGGRLDATNTVDPVVSVITSISVDHSAYLGDNRQAVAREKAGIIKPGVSLITGEDDPEVIKIFRKVCRRMCSPLIEANLNYTLQTGKQDKKGQFLSIRGPRRRYDRLFLPLLGEHQARNCRIALAAWEEGEPNSISVPLNRIRGALGGVRWPGRFEIREKPARFIIDGAHNPAGAHALAQSLKKFLKNKSFILILGVLADKDVKGICRELVPRAREVLVVRVESSRALSSGRLTRICRALGEPSRIQVLNLKTLESALQYCYHSFLPTDWICIAGSLRLAGQARNLLARR